MTTSLSTPEAIQRENWARYRWTGFILCFFLIQAVIWTVAIVLTNGDRSHSVVAGYDENSLKWDEQRAAQLTSDRLGWTHEFQFQSANIRGEREVILTVRDSQGNPVRGARVEVVAFHCARAAEKQEVPMTYRETGDYSGQVRVRRSGWWEMSGTVKMGNDVYLISDRQKLSK